MRKCKTSYKMIINLFGFHHLANIVVLRIEWFSFYKFLLKIATQMIPFEICLDCEFVDNERHTTGFPSFECNVYQQIVSN